MVRAAETTGKTSAFSKTLKLATAVGVVQGLRSHTVRSTVSKTFDTLKKTIRGERGSAGDESWSVRDERKGAQMSTDEVGKCVADCLNSAEGRAVTEQLNAVTDRILHS